MSKELLQQEPELQKKVMEIIKEASNITTEIELKQGSVKDIKARAKTEFGIDGKLFGKLFKLYHNQAREQFEEENTEVLEIYDMLVAPPKPTVGTV